MAAADGSAAADAARVHLERIRDALNAEVRRLLLALDTERGGQALVSDKQALATAVRVRQQVLTLLEQRGGAVVDEMERAMAQAAQEVARSVDLGPFDADAMKTLEEIARGQTDEVITTFRDGRARIGVAMRAGLTTQAELGELIDQVAREIETTFAKAQSAVDAAIMGAGRSVTLRAGSDAASEAGEPVVFRVVGPSDGKTRDFCRAVVGRCFSADALERLDNGDQPRPVSIYLGGYNCRHSLAPMLLSDAEAAGYDVTR